MNAEQNENDMGAAAPAARTEFTRIIIDMTNDLLLTFPELKANLHTDLKNIVALNDVDSVENVFKHCSKVFPPKFFEIINQDANLFISSVGDNDDTEFLPGIQFNVLWAADNLSDTTRETLWKYLQLVLFSVMASAKENLSFLETANIFENLNATDFQTKLEETMDQMQNMFKKDDADADGEEEASDKEGASTAAPEPMPNMADMHEHMSGLMNSKLGTLAKEIAAETAADLNIGEGAGAESVGDVFKGLLKNPTKLMGLVKNVGSKLDAKIKSGDMKESELMQEASDLLGKMKNMPGMGNLQSMFSKMGMEMPGGAAAAAAGGKGKMNVNAMQSQLARNIKAAQQKERLNSRLADKQQQQQATNTTTHLPSQPIAKPLTDEMLFSIFSKGEKMEKSTDADKTKTKSKGKKKGKKNE
jgi:hypothetical protein